MSYGFQLLNSDGIVLANDTDFNYGLVASGVGYTSSLSPSTYDLNFTNTTDKYPLVFVRGISSDYIGVMGFFTNQISFKFFSQLTNLEGYRSQINYTTSFQYRVYLPMNALPTTVAGGDEYGIHVFNSNGQKTFDSTKSYPVISGTSTVTIYSSFTDSVAAIPGNINNTPWVAISSLPAGVIRRGPGTGGAKMNTYKCMRIANNQIQISQGESPASIFTTNFDFSNAAAAKTFYFMNTVTVDPVSAFIGEYFQGATTCTYNPTSTSFCSTNQYFIVNVAGGNNNPFTYNWSLSSPANGFYIDGGNTSYLVSIKNDQTGSASPYTATLTCTVSQTGSTAQSPTIALSHTHTAVANPLVITAAVSAQTATCSSTVSCTTQETWTASVTGGNGGAISYLWEFVGAANGFVFSSTNTAATTVSLNNTGAASGTVYSCTIRCTASQSGMPSVSVEKSVSHTHTTTSGFTIQNPMATGLQGSTTDSTATGGVTIYLYIYPTGYWEIYSTADGTMSSGTWGTPITTGIGNSYSVFFTRTAGGTGTSPSSTDWQVLSTTRSVFVNASAAFNNQTRTGVYNVQIKDINTGVVVSTTNNITLQASAIYDDGGTAPP